MLYAAGVRLMELVDMKRVDTNWPEHMITIPKGKRKKERIVLFTRECGEHLNAFQNWLKVSNPLVYKGLGIFKIISFNVNSTIE